MSDLVDAVAAVVRLNGGELVGKTRLQKTIYLLEAMKLGFGADFDYHNFGPFSSELAFAADDAVALGYLETDQRRGYHAVPYSVFRVTKATPDCSDHSGAEARRQALAVISCYPASVLELAATAVYLREHGYADSYWVEVRARKPLKATDDRLSKAKALLRDLRL